MEELYKGAIGRLNRYKVRYLVCGGVAVALYGYNRTTEDIDIMIATETKNMDKFLKVMEKMRMTSALPKNKEEIKRAPHTMFVSKIPEYYYFKIDLVKVSTEKFNDYWKRRKIFKFDNMKFFVISREDLIKIKKRSMRGKDQIDVSELEKMEYLRRH